MKSLEELAAERALSDGGHDWTSSAFGWDFGVVDSPWFRDTLVFIGPYGFETQFPAPVVAGITAVGLLVLVGLTAFAMTKACRGSRRVVLGPYLFCSAVSRHPTWPGPVIARLWNNFCTRQAKSDLLTRSGWRVVAATGFTSGSTRKAGMMHADFDNMKPPEAGELVGILDRLRELGFDAARQVIVDEGLTNMAATDEAFAAGDVQKHITEAAIANLQTWREVICGDLMAVLRDNDGKRVARLIQQRRNLQRGRT